MQGYAWHALQRRPVVAPALASDDIQRRAGKTVLAQRADDMAGGDEILARLDGAERHYAQRSGADIARIASRRLQIEDVAHRGAIQRDLRIVARVSADLAQRVA